MHFLGRIAAGLHTEKRIYLDYAAATPLRHEVLAAMQPVLRDVFANASGIHQEGQRARQLIDAAREQVARTLQVRVEDVIFTSGGTEANNIAVRGVIAALHAAGRAYTDMEVITTAIEHPSLSKACSALREQGVVVHEVAVTETGEIDLVQLTELVSDKTVLLATSYVNSEIGVIQPLRKMKRILTKVGTARLLVDGAQAPLWLPCQLEQIGADILTLDGGKMYGPKGSGAVIKRHGVVLAPSAVLGGGQERGLRPGTENTAQIVGFETALILAQQNYERRSDGVSKLRDYFMTSLEQIEGVIINGSRTDRVANNVNISLPGVDTEFAVVWLDEHGVAASTKSACSGAGGGESAVVKAISGDAARAASTIRFTLGETSSKAEIDQVVDLLKTHLMKMQKIDAD